jgi:hypothetical protein
MAVQQPLYQSTLNENIANLFCKSLSGHGLVREGERGSSKTERILFCTHFILGDTGQGNALSGSPGEPEMEPDLLVEMFHCGGTEEDEEANPERNLLERDRFIGFFFAFFYIIGLEDHRVEKEREKAEDEKQLDKEDDQVFRMVLDPASRLRGDELIDIVEIDATGKQQDNEQDSRNFLVMLIERIGDWLDLFLRHHLLQPRGHGYDEERESADPDDR